MGVCGGGDYDARGRAARGMCGPRLRVRSCALTLRLALHSVSRTRIQILWPTKAAAVAAVVAAGAVAAAILDAVRARFLVRRRHHSPHARRWRPACITKERACARPRLMSSLYSHALRGRL